MNYSELTSWANLLAAYRGAAKGKRGQPGVAAFEHRLEDELVGLRRELRDGSYRPGGYRSFTIREPKRRVISAAPFRDRVVHHALCRVIEPAFERAFVAESFANRKGKGTHRALDHCQRLARRYPFVLQLDVRQFFPSIDHEILRRELGRKIKEARILALVDRILASGRDVLIDEYAMVYFPGDDLFAVNRPRGLPIGNLTSQFWANVYLGPLDHCIKRELGCRGYVRYVDDLVLFAGSKHELWRWKERIVARLEGLRLTAHQGAHPRPVGEGVPFLGFVIRAERRRLKRRKAVEYRRRLRRLAAELERGAVGEAEVRASVAGWLNHIRYGNTVGLRRAILAQAPTVMAGRPLRGATRGRRLPVDSENTLRP